MRFPAWRHCLICIPCLILFLVPACEPPVSKEERDHFLVEVMHFLDGERTSLEFVRITLMGETAEFSGQEIQALGQLLGGMRDRTEIEKFSGGTHDKKVGYMIVRRAGAEMKIPMFKAATNDPLIHWHIPDHRHFASILVQRCDPKEELLAVMRARNRSSTGK